MRPVGHARFDLLPSRFSIGFSYPTLRLTETFA